MVTAVHSKRAHRPIGSPRFQKEKPRLTTHTFNDSEFASPEQSITRWRVYKMAASFKFGRSLLVTYVTVHSSYYSSKHK